MQISQQIDIRNSREVKTPGGIFLTFIPHLFKGDRGDLIMVEKAIVEKIKTGEPVTVKEKTNEKGKYFVVRAPKGGEDKYRLFTLSCGGSQDRREHYGHFNVSSVVNGIVVCDITSDWGDNHEVIIALKEGGYAKVEGNHGSGFKGRDPQPDFLVTLKGDGSQESITDLDVD